MAIAIALPGLKDLGRSVTRNYLLMDHFLYRFPTFSKNLSIRSSHFLQNAPSNSVLFSSSLSVRQYQMPLEGLSFVKTLATFGIVNATDPLVQKNARIVCLR